MERSESVGWWVFVWDRQPSWCRDVLVTGKSWSERSEGDVCATGWQFDTEQEARAHYETLGKTLHNTHPWFELANDGATVEEMKNPGYGEKEERLAELEEQRYRELCRAEWNVIYGANF